VAYQSRSRFPVAYARQPGDERAERAQGLNEPAARSLEYWAASRGDQPALHEGRTSLTYAEWNEYADMLADAFASRGLGVNDVVAVRCRNRIEWAVIAIACAKIDARLLTLDPDLPASMIRQQLIASGASAIIVGDMAPVRIAAALDGLSLRLRASMDAAYPGFFNFWDLFPPVAQPRFGRVQPSLMAWTSGAGKAYVALPRRRAAPASLSRPAVREEGASLVTLPMHHTWGCMQFWSALAAGREVIMMRAFNSSEALDAIRARQVTHWWAFPETFLELKRRGNLLAAADTSSLKEVMIGGAAAPWALKAWLADIFGAIFSEAYGSTQTGHIATLPAEAFATKRGSCGRPIPGAAVEIRDARGQRLPPGVVGEIWARTPRTLECELGGEARQVRRDAEGFVATCDAGHVDQDGFLYLAGRAPLAPDAADRKAG
jgi:acyl-CoA synthetase (AMP-forming)/AMP-acid ligase II